MPPSRGAVWTRHPAPARTPSVTRKYLGPKNPNGNYWPITIWPIRPTTREIYLFAQIPRKLSLQRNRKPVRLLSCGLIVFSRRLQFQATAKWIATQNGIAGCSGRMRCPVVSGSCCCSTMRSSTATSSDKPTYTRAQIAQLYEQHRKGCLRWQGSRMGSARCRHLCGPARRKSHRV